MLMRHGFSLLAVMFLAASCGSSRIGNGPCEGANPAASCGVTCAYDLDCDSGYHCTAQNECFAECTANGSGCAQGYNCDQSGRCQPDPGNGPDANVCPRVQVSVEPQIPTVQLLIDQSGSMTETFGNTNRWQAVRSALVEPGGAVAQLESTVKFGATLYSSLGGNNGPGGCPLLVKTPPGFNSRQAIADLLANNDPQSDTPTAESITAVANAFPPADPNQPGPRIIVLATDGNPDNCVDPDAHDASSQMMSEQAAQAAYSQGIQLFVLSVGDQVSVPHLQRMANAGQGLPLDTGNATFYVANNPDELVNAFQDIIQGVRSCTFSLDGNVTDPDSGIVELNGASLDYGTDWSLPNPSTLQLLGTACDTFLNADNADLYADFACGAVVL